MDFGDKGDLGTPWAGGYTKMVGGLGGLNILLQILKALNPYLSRKSLGALGCSRLILPIPPLTLLVGGGKFLSMDGAIVVQALFNQRCEAATRPITAKL
jgi:hypothetical protein